MEPTTDARLQALEEKIDKITISVEKTRKYLQWTFIITVAVFVLPLIAAAFVVPAFIGNYTSTIQNLTQ